MDKTAEHGYTIVKKNEITIKRIPVSATITQEILLMIFFTFSIKFPSFFQLDNFKFTE